MQIANFLGIHNTNPPRSIPDAALSDAVNVDITDSGAILSRPGITSALALAISSAYACSAGAFLVSDGTLYRINPDLSLTELAASTATAFADHGDIVFTNDGLMINGATVHDLKAMHTPNSYPVAEGSATVLPQHVNDDPLTRFSDGYPANVEFIAWYDAALWCASSLDNQTVLWHSKPFHYHLFDYERDYLLIPGRVIALQGIGDALCIGTTDAVYLYNGALQKVANYGVVAGRPFAKAPDNQYFVFTQRGICRVSPFENLTEKKVKPVAAATCAATMIEHNGYIKMVVAHD